MEWKERESCGWGLPSPLLSAAARKREKNCYPPLWRKGKRDAVQSGREKKSKKGIFLPPFWLGRVLSMCFFFCPAVAMVTEKGLGSVASTKGEKETRHFGSELHPLFLTPLIFFCWKLGDNTESLSSSLMKTYFVIIFLFFWKTPSAFAGQNLGERGDEGLGRRHRKQAPDGRSYSSEGRMAGTFVRSVGRWVRPFDVVFARRGR